MFVNGKTICHPSDIIGNDACLGDFIITERLDRIEPRSRQTVRLCFIKRKQILHDLARFSADAVDAAVAVHAGHQKCTKNLDVLRHAMTEVHDGL